MYIENYNQLKNIVRLWLPYLLMVIVAFLLYMESFGHEWTMDDHIVVVQNLDIRALSGFLENNYPGRPLRELTYLLDYQLFGIHPAGYHFQNILWHGLNACLLVLIATTLGASSPVAWLSGALFLVHPINTEVVANISHRKDSLMLFFIQLALLAALRFYRYSSWLQKFKSGGLAMFSFTVASLAKQTAAGLLPLILGYELTQEYQQNRFFLRNKKLVWLVLAGACGFAIFWYVRVWQSSQFQESVVGSLVRLKVYSGLSNEVYLLVILKSLSFMILRLIWPMSLAMEYVFDVPKGWFDPWVMSALGVSVAAVTFFFVFRFRHKLIAFGILWFFAFWLPVSNLLWPSAYFAADRYMYASSAGFSLLVSTLLVYFLKERKLLIASASAILLIGMCFLTWQQNRTWNSELALFQQALKVSPGSTRALMGMGIEYMDAGRLDLAKSYLEKAAMDFNDSKSLHLLGQLYEKKGDIRTALRYYQRFIMMNEARYRADILSLRKHLRMRYGSIDF